ncbi:MAG: hypothetical protein KDE19_02915, partial [Caldilineaceae bacterium]|nr:hypothetical protein [Caldilineaceae bacterium]
MNEQAQITAMTTAQAVLSEAWHRPVQLAMMAAIDSSSRSAVQRCQVTDGPADAPSSVIVKRAVNDDAASFNATDVDAFVVQRFWNEWASLQFLSEAFDGAPPAPRLYGADRATGLLVLEDLGQGTTLIGPVLGNEPEAATTGLIELMTTLGRLHAQTIGKEQGYLRIRHALGPSQAYFSPAAEGALLPACLAEPFSTLLDTLGIPTIAGLEQDLAAVTQFWAEPGPFLAYTHGDAVPGNEFKVGDQRKLVDFEFGGFRHALTEGITARIQFVTGFYVQGIPVPVTLTMENAYRAELVKGCPQADDDAIFYRAITEACAYATIAMWHWAMPNML